MALQGTERADHGAGSGEGVLRRLLTARSQAETGAGKAPQLPQPVPLTPARAGATAVGRAAERLYRLAVQPVAVTPGALTLAELPEILPSPALLIVLQGPGDLVGMAALCPETVTALTEIQALGRITARATERRRMTRSDAMICADFVNALMADLANEMAAVEGFDGIKGYRYATWLDDPRPLSLMLEDRPYRSLAFDLRLGGTESRESRIFIALPQPPAQDRAAGRPDLPAPMQPVVSPGPATSGAPQPVSQPAEGQGARPSAAPKADLAGLVQAAPVELVGVLCRRRISLGELRGLTPGRLLSLPRVSLGEARLETRDGQLLAVGKFGEAEGCHAIRLRDPDLAAGSLSLPETGASAAAVSAPNASRVEPPIDDLAHPDAFRGSRPQPLGGGGQAVDPLAAAPPKAVSGG